VPGREEPLVFELSRPGKVGFSLPEPSGSEPETGVELELVRDEMPEGLPELSETEVVRHFTRLSRLNYAIDQGMFPLGSCTMKHNPRVNERTARLPGLSKIHPLQEESTVQGALEVMADLERALCAITGMHAYSLQPAAGAHGELTGMLIIRKRLLDKGDTRTKVLVPDSAHGTNPASCILCGMEPEEVRSGADGRIDFDAFEERISRGDVAALMLTNPNTLGIFENRIAEVCRLLHERGGYVYGDGANLNAMLGLTRPGDQGIDVIHLNLHKTFTTPHGGGGPGSGPVGVTEELAPYLPTPRVVRRDGALSLSEDFPNTIGRINGFYGNFGMMVRALTYIREMGSAGLRQAAQDAILNANYVRQQLSEVLDLPFDSPTMHEVVFSDRRLEKRTGVTTMDLAKRLMDHGFHPPTVYFPLIVHGALMTEPTETESRTELDAFVDAVKSICREAESDPETVKSAPWHTPLRRLDEVRANRQLVLRWQPEQAVGAR
jgi:glycine dehydrogenase subunit 2